MRRLIRLVISPMVRWHRWDDGVYEVAIGRRFSSWIFDVSFNPITIEKVR